MSTFDFTDSATWGGRPVARRVADARPRERVVVTGTIGATATVSLGGTASYSCVLSDGTGEIGVLFIGRRTVAGLASGTRCTVEATAILQDGLLVLWNPLYRIESNDAA